MSTTETKVRKIALSQTRYELFEVTHDDSLGREVLSRPLNVDEVRQVVAVYNSHADMLEALEDALEILEEAHIPATSSAQRAIRSRVRHWKDKASATIAKAKGGAA